jgi:alpha-ribazole phosphatase/probable phosphoglycerate mutase
MRMILLRHGEPEASARGRCYGELDVGLSDEGRAQAASLRIEPVEAVYCSPRRRALETARIVKPDMDPRIDPALREIDFGRFEGLSYDEAAALDPELYAKWMSSPTEVTFPGGESWPILRDRVRQFAARIRKLHDKVLIVAHGGPLRALLAEALGLPDAHIFRIDQKFAGLSIIDWFGEIPLVKLVNG